MVPKTSKAPECPVCASCAPCFCDNDKEKKEENEEAKKKEVKKPKEEKKEKEERKPEEKPLLRHLLDGFMPAVYCAIGWWGKGIFDRVPVTKKRSRPESVVAKKKSETERETLLKTASETSSTQNSDEESFKHRSKKAIMIRPEQMVSNDSCYLMDHQ